jgi:GH15 family glucan-1,4-alpha-glucosidase
VGTTSDHTITGQRYLPIDEHGIIGDLHTAALIGTDGTIDWFSPGRFDGRAYLERSLIAPVAASIGSRRWTRALRRSSSTCPRQTS